MITRNIAIALRAFDLRNWIDGCESGGIDPVKKILDYTEEDDIVDIKYTYPAICGLSDVRYHVIDHGKVFHETYRISENKIYLMNKEGKWDTKLFSNWLKMESINLKINTFYKNYGFLIPKTA